MRKHLLGAAIITLLATSCEKDKDFTEATVMDTGDITEEGCGYLLRLNDGREEKPEYLPSAYQHNDLQVKVKYHSTGVLDTCQFTIPRKFFERIAIDEIKRNDD